MGEPIDPACPGEDALLALVNGFVRGDAARALEVHLDGCARCHALVALARPRGSARLADDAAADTADVDGPAPETGAPREVGPGDVLGRYRILEPLGQGAMGRVYLAHDPELDRLVAIKVLRRHSDELRARLRREARAMARLSHPGLVTVHDVGETEAGVFIAMEHVEGPTLAHWLSARGRATSAIVDRFVEAGRGLAAAHRAGVIHRDFKPDNVLIDAGGRARVADFGLARLDDLDGDGAVTGDDGERAPYATRPRTRIGTPAYMAPEQLAGGPVDARADVFAFAASLWEALAGAPPFPIGSVDSRLRAIDAGRIASPPRGWIPRRIERALRHALAARPADRPADLEELLAALAPRHRHRRALAVAGVLVAAAGAALVIGWRMRTRPASPTARDVVRHRVVAAEGPDAVDHAALSPDGSRVAYSDYRGGLHLTELRDGETRALAASAPIAGLQWLGTRLAVLVCPPRDDCRLELVAEDGGPSVVAAARLPRGTLAALGGDRFAIAERDHPRVSIVSTAGRDLGQLRAWPDGARLEAIATTPDGRRLAAYDAAGRTIDVIDVEQGAITASLPVDGALAGLVWLGDRRLLYGVVEARVLTHLHALAIDGAGRATGAPRKLVTLDAPVELVGASADGRRVAYAIRERRTVAYVAPLADALGAATQVSDALFDHAVMAWTPDGRALLTQSEREDGPAIERIPLDGGAARVLAAGERPTLAPGGDRILYLRRRAHAAGNRWTLHAMTLDGRPLEPTVALGDWPAGVGVGVQCAPATPRCLAGIVADQVSRYRWLDRADGALVPVTGVSDGPMWTSALAPTGDRLALSPDRRRVELVDLATGARRELAREDCQLHRMAWSPDGRTLYASCLEPTLSPSYLIRYRIDPPGAREVIAQTPFVFTRLTVSPDGARLAYSITDIGGTLWTAEGL